MFNSLMPSLNIRSLPFVVFMGGFPSRLQNLSSGAIRPGGLLFIYFVDVLFPSFAVIPCLFYFSILIHFVYSHGTVQLFYFCYCLDIGDACFDCYCWSRYVRYCDKETLNSNKQTIDCYCIIWCNYCHVETYSYWDVYGCVKSPIIAQARIAVAFGVDCGTWRILFMMLFMIVCIF